MNILKRCKLCNENKVFTDPLEMIETTMHNKSCPFINKLIKDQRWKFWIRESYDYINLNENENTKN